MNLMTSLGNSVVSWFKRPRAPHQPHPGLWVLTALVLALLGTAAAFLRNLDDEPKIALGTRVPGHIGGLVMPDQPASGSGAASVMPLQPGH